MHHSRSRRWAVTIAVLCATLILAACSSSSSSSGGSTAASPTTAAKSLGADPAASAGDPSQAAYTPTGTLIADDGFRPDANGFKFQNYGPPPPGGTSLTADDVRKLFGDTVCADLTSGKCDLIPEAAAWMAQENAGMEGGHCYGFAVAAQELWQSKVATDSFGSSSINSLSIDGNTALQRQIAYNWAYQKLESVRAGAVQGTPNDIITFLKTALVPNPPETFTVGMFSDHGGHAVTPYAIEDHGGGVDKILVYDNNWPGVTRAITVDTTANTWQYVAALNPNEPSELYAGDANTKSLLLFPTSPGRAAQPCPFCGKVPAAAGGGSALPARGSTGRSVVLASTAGAPDAPAMDDIYLSGSDTDHAHLLITDPSGKQTGYLNGKLVNNIAGAQVIQNTSDQSWLATFEPEYYVPDGVKYTIAIDGSGLKGNDTETVGIIGPSYDLSADQIQVAPGDKDTLTVAPDGTQLSYSASRPESPQFELAVSDTTADWTFDISGVSDQAGATVNFGLPQEGTSLTIDPGSSGGTTTFKMQVLREDDKGKTAFSHDGITLASGDQGELQFGNFSTDNKSIPFVITHGGAKQAPTDLSDQA